jgi:hypothetical protein
VVGAADGNGQLERDVRLHRDYLARAGETGLCAQRRAQVTLRSPR